jgi:hypothetical protein
MHERLPLVGAPDFVTQLALEQFINPGGGSGGIGFAGRSGALASAGEIWILLSRALMRSTRYLASVYWYAMVWVYVQWQLKSLHYNLSNYHSTHYKVHNTYCLSDLSTCICIRTAFMNSKCTHWTVAFHAGGNRNDIGVPLRIERISLRGR